MLKNVVAFWRLVAPHLFKYSAGAAWSKQQPQNFDSMELGELALGKARPAKAYFTNKTKFIKTIYLAVLAEAHLPPPSASLPPTIFSPLPGVWYRPLCKPMLSYFIQYHTLQYTLFCRPSLGFPIFSMFSATFPFPQTGKD